MYISYCTVSILVVYHCIGIVYDAIEKLNLKNLERLRNQYKKIKRLSLEVNTLQTVNNTMTEDDSASAKILSIFINLYL